MSGRLSAVVALFAARNLSASNPGICQVKTHNKMYITCHAGDSIPLAKVSNSPFRVMWEI